MPISIFIILSPISLHGLRELLNNFYFRSKDPWGSGGYLKSMNLNPAITCIWIEGGAHHLDLRLPNPKDPESVTAARQKETEVLRQWIRDYHLE